jgi:hypothetical protein
VAPQLRRGAPTKPGLTLPRRFPLLVTAAIAGLVGCAPRETPPIGAAVLAATPPPATLRLDPYYAHYVDADGIAVVGSARVPVEALLGARTIVLAMLAHRPDLKAVLVRQGARVGVIAADEAITDLPEYRGWKKPAKDDPRLTACELKHYAAIEAVSDRDYWNARARGAGGLFTTVGAENLLASPGGRYFGENILVHEFSHAILEAVRRGDPILYRAIEAAYAQAKARGLWSGDYAGVTVEEYWAEGTQFWFNDNMLARLDGADIVSDEDLRRYDPALFAVLARVYGGRHRIAGDPFYRHPARMNVPIGYKSADC